MSRGRLIGTYLGQPIYEDDGLAKRQGAILPSGELTGLEKAEKPAQGLSGVEVDSWCLEDMNGPQIDAMGDEA